MSLDWQAAALKAFLVRAVNDTRTAMFCLRSNLTAMSVFHTRATLA